MRKIICLEKLLQVGRAAQRTFRKILLRLLPDNTLCLFEEECFKEMETRGLIVWAENIDESKS
jgi:hypothetical protein